MGIAGGPNLNQDGLVFLYDVFDQDNSYKGKPTTNYFTNGHFSGGNGIPQEGGSNATNTIIQLDNPGNSPWVLQQNGNFTEYQINLGAELAPSTTYVMSGWYAESLNFNGTTTMMHARAFSNSGAHNATSDGLGTVLYSRQVGSILWKYCYQAITTPADYSNNFNWYVGYGSPSHTGYRYYTNLQMELGSTPSQFVNGTRSTTQGLLDVAGTNQIDLTNVSFDVNAQMIFDGTNDNIALSSTVGNFGTNDWSISCWWKSSGTQDDYASIISQGFIYPISAGGWSFKVKNASGENFLSFSYATAGEAITNLVTSAACNDGNWHNLVAVKNVGTVTLYMDGVIVGSSSPGPSLSFGTGATTYLAYTPRDAAYLYGYLNNFATYNRALSGIEVLQNYNATKSRFNLK
jgi:hypothetical protein